MAGNPAERAGNIVEVVLWIAGILAAFAIFGGIIVGLEEYVEPFFDEHPGVIGIFFLNGVLFLLLGYIFDVPLLLGIGWVLVIVVGGLFFLFELW